jgi:hypothetical protein
VVFWFLMPYSLVGGYQHFGGKYCLHLKIDVFHTLLCEECVKELTTVSRIIARFVSSCHHLNKALHTLLRVTLTPTLVSVSSALVSAQVFWQSSTPAHNFIPHGVNLNTAESLTLPLLTIQIARVFFYKYYF